MCALDVGRVESENACFLGAHNGCHRVFVTDWRSATRDMRLLTIDSYLAELNVAVDELGAPPAGLLGLPTHRFWARRRETGAAKSSVDLYFILDGGNTGCGPGGLFCNAALVPCVYVA